MVQVVLLLDVDFVPPEELSRIFSARQEYQSTLVYLYNNAVIVLPAFETLQAGAEGQQLALKLAKGDSTTLSSILPATCFNVNPVCLVQGDFSDITSLVTN